MATTTPPTPQAPAVQPAGLTGWIEVFRAGTHTDSAGKRCTFTTADLDQMVANVALGKPPAVLGHPKHDDPAYGWGELKRADNSLFARFDDVNPAFEAGVKSGAYRNRSVSVLKDKAHGWRVRHVGWLGAAPPAIDGLTPVSFSAADDGAEMHEFASEDLTTAWAFGDVSRLFRGLREWVIGKHGVDEADKVLPEYSITNLSDASTTLREQALAEDAAEAKPLFAAPNTPTEGTTPMSTFTAADIEAARVAAAAEATAEAEARFTAQAAELTRLQSERQAERIGAQITAWKAAGQLLPAHELGLAEFMAALESTGSEFQFTASGSTEPVKETPAVWFARFMSAKTPALRLGQQQAAAESDAADKPVLSDREVADLARNYQAAQGALGHRITLPEAIDAVQAGKHTAKA